jgi:hypothetical protein
MSMIFILNQIKFNIDRMMMNYWKPYKKNKKKIKCLIINSSPQQCGAQINICVIFLKPIVWSTLHNLSDNLYFFHFRT